MFEVAVLCLVLTALLAYISHRFLHLPTTIGVMAIAMLLSFALIGLDRLGISGLHDREVALLKQIDFSRVLLQGMLSVLLFAGALHVDLEKLHRYRWQVGVLAVFGTLASTVIVGYATWWLLPTLGIALPLAYCLVFGALISPTDPVSVIGILKSAGAPKSLETVHRRRVALQRRRRRGRVRACWAGVVTAGKVPTLPQGLWLLAREGRRRHRLRPDAG